MLVGLVIFEYKKLPNQYIYRFSGINFSHFLKSIFDSKILLL